MTNFFAILGMLVVIMPFMLGVSLLGLMWRAWWLYPAWAWFIVPLGLRQVSFWYFTALLLIVQVVTHQSDTKKDERKQDWVLFIVLFTWPILAWALLWWLR